MKKTKNKKTDVLFISRDKEIIKQFGIPANHIVVKKEIFNAILNHIKKQKVKK